MSIVAFAEEAPDRIALVYGNGESRETYAQLEARSRRIAHLLRACGLQEGDSIAALLGNDDEFFDIYWAAIRTGLYFTAVNWHLAPDEISRVPCELLALDLGQAVHAFLLHARRNRVWHVGGGSPGAGAVGEAVDLVHAQLAAGGERLGEVVLVLAGESDDHVGGEAEIGDRVPQCVHGAMDGAATVPALHGAQHAIASALQWQMQVRREQAAGRKDLDELRRDLLELERREPQPA